MYGKISINFFKAFDCVEHDALVSKLHHSVVEGRGFDLPNSYWDVRVVQVDANIIRPPGTAV